MKSRTQQAIEAHRRKLRTTYLEALESAYLTSPENDFYEPGVRISGGEAEIVIPTHERFRMEAGSPLSASLCFKAMNDSAHLAVKTLVQGSPVSTVEYTVQLADPTAGRELIARSLFVGMSGNQYMTESVLTDSEGRELGRAKGMFTVGEGATTP
jgi:hypothetical protein